MIEEKGLAPERLFKGIKGFDRVCIPVFERIKHLYALGYSTGSIAAQMDVEYSDVDVSIMDKAAIKRIIEFNRAEFDHYRLKIADACMNSNFEHTVTLYNITQHEEQAIVSEYNRKVAEALSELSDLSLCEQDEKGNFKNTARIFVLMELIEKFHKKCSDIIGTQAMRDLEIYRQKMELKDANTKKGGLLPSMSQPGENKDLASPTKFLD